MGFHNNVETLYFNFTLNVLLSFLLSFMNIDHLQSDLKYICEHVCAQNNLFSFRFCMSCKTLHVSMGKEALHIELH